MLVRFINQSGLVIEQDGFCLMVDPWFIPSTFNNFALKGIVPPTLTVDFQLKPTRDLVTSFKPNAILISLLHPHHSPLVEIYTLISQARTPVTLATPVMTEQSNQSVRKVLNDFLDKIELRSCRSGETFEIGPFKVRAMSHTFEQTHLGWHIQSNEGSVLHLVDARINRDPSSRTLDSIWNEYRDLKPDLLFIGAGGRTTAVSNDGKFDLREGEMMSPIEAARLTAFIAPRVAMSCGNINHSIRERQADYTLPYSLAEDQFAWALHKVAPKTKTLALQPGYVFTLKGGDVSLQL